MLANAPKVELKGGIEDWQSRSQMSLDAGLLGECGRGSWCILQTSLSGGGGDVPTKHSPDDGRARAQCMLF
ncbi:hypothetical protein TKK_0010924 [Trichogramma kaykai]